MRGFILTLSGEGSSPLARGLLAEIRVGDSLLGIIPARAGFTHADAIHAAPVLDHPRSRGVYRRVDGPEGGPPGSSPLARGLRGDGGRVAGPAGIIPARAGFTRVTEPEALSALGSSPLARGLQPRDPHPPGGRRIIPARAGFTPHDTQSTDKWRDHPRSRGVYDDYIPRCRELGRIIPARAGFTFHVPGRLPRGRDHPRSRGVYLWTAGRTALACGSSPLARGLPRTGSVLR